MTMGMIMCKVVVSAVSKDFDNDSFKCMIKKPLYCRHTAKDIFLEPFAVLHHSIVLLFIA